MPSARVGPSSKRQNPAAAATHVRAKLRGNGEYQMRHGKAPLIAPEDRQRYIAEAAYFRALERGFEGGAELADWLAAEAEIESRYLVKTKAE